MLVDVLSVLLFVLEVVDRSGTLASSQESLEVRSWSFLVLCVCVGGVCRRGSGIIRS